MGLFGLGKKQEVAKPASDSGIVLKFKINSTVSYKELIEGFFRYKGEIFYRPKNQGARHVITSETFIDFAKRKDESIVKSSEVSNLVVEKLEVITKF